jgi:hypothetical protein
MIKSSPEGSIHQESVLRSGYPFSIAVAGVFEVTKIELESSSRNIQPEDRGHL